MSPYLKWIQASYFKNHVLPPYLALPDSECCVLASRCLHQVYVCSRSSTTTDWKGQGQGQCLLSTKRIKKPSLFPTVDLFLWSCLSTFFFFLSLHYGKFLTNVKVARIIKLMPVGMSPRANSHHIMAKFIPSMCPSIPHPKLFQGKAQTLYHFFCKYFSMHS